MDWLLLFALGHSRLMWPFRPQLLHVADAIRSLSRSRFSFQSDIARRNLYSHTTSTKASAEGWAHWDASRAALGWLLAISVNAGCTQPYEADMAASLAPRSLRLILVTPSSTDLSPLGCHDPPRLGRTALAGLGGEGRRRQELLSPTGLWLFP